MMFGLYIHLFSLGAQILHACLNLFLCFRRLRLSGSQEEDGYEISDIGHHLFNGRHGRIPEQCFKENPDVT